MIAQKLEFITRKARFWPEIPHDIVKLPATPAVPNPPSRITLITLGIGLVGMVLSGVLFALFSNGAGSFILIFVAMSGVTAVSGGVSYVAQKRTAIQQTLYLQQAYQKKLAEAENDLRVLQRRERQALLALDPPFVLPSRPSPWYEHVSVISIVQRSLDEQDLGLWVRRPTDSDFLSVRVGMGEQPATFKVQGEQRSSTVTLPSVFDEDAARAHSLEALYASLLAPVRVSLSEQGVVALVANATADGLLRVRELVRAMLCQVAYHHSPEEVRIVILAPESQSVQWQWAQALPHTQLYDPHQTEGTVGSQKTPPALAIGLEAIIDQLPLISRELSRRELLADNERHDMVMMLPHLVIVVDHFDPVADIDPPPLTLPVSVRSSPGLSSPGANRQLLREIPLKRAELTLALVRSTHLGVSVLCVCAQKSDVPMTTAMTIDVEAASSPVALLQGQTQPGPQTIMPLYAVDPVGTMHRQVTAGQRGESEASFTAHVRLLRPDPPPAVACRLLDAAPMQELNYFAGRMQNLWPTMTKRPQLRTQVDLRALFEPSLNLDAYNPAIFWSEARLRLNGEGTRGGTSEPILRIPIGQKMGDDIQHLDFIKDGPHGLLIGQTGSGKSELLQTIIMATAMIYRPEEVTFLLIDYKAGLALEPFRHLPHTIGFLSNVSSPALIARFITMLRAEAVRREVRKRQHQAFPRLVIIIDEFAEMAKRTETVLDELFTITRVGREIGMHLLLAAQRPEGIIGNKVRDYVQYRICLRAASPEDSREVIGRVDAAHLPASTPGRGFLLHGDNQLELFQAARVTQPA